MPSRLSRFAGRRGRRAVVLLGLIPVLFAAYETAVLTHGTVSAVALGVFLSASAVFLTLGWQMSFGRRNG